MKSYKVSLDWFDMEHWRYSETIIIKAEDEQEAEDMAKEEWRNEHKGEDDLSLTNVVVLGENK